MTATPTGATVAAPAWCVVQRRRHRQASFLLHSDQRQEQHASSSKAQAAAGPSADGTREPHHGSRGGSRQEWLQIPEVLAEGSHSS